MMSRSPGCLPTLVAVTLKIPLPNRERDCHPAPLLCHCLKAMLPSPASEIPTLASLELQPYLDNNGQLPESLQGRIGVYAIFDAAQTLQLVNYSRDVYLSLKQHLVRQPHRCYGFKLYTISDRPWKPFNRPGFKKMGCLRPVMRMRRNNGHPRSMLNLTSRKRNNSNTPRRQNWIKSSC